MLVMSTALSAALVFSCAANTEAVVAATSRPLPTTYIKADYTPLPLSWGDLPYNSPALYGYDRDVPRDATGVRMYVQSGVQYNHPVEQAHDGLMSLSDYRHTGAARDLDRAVLDAQRIIDRRVVSDGAWYYPYPYSFPLHGFSNPVMRPPWYSGMAQGLVLSLFVRLNQVTGEQKWRDAADATFASFRNAPVQGLPSTVNIDPSGYLWLEEYPLWPPTASDRTLNGHLFSAFGLYDYQRLTGDPVARDLWNGALANVRYHLPRGYRAANWISRYCLAHPSVRSAKYHDIHWHQMITLHAATGDPLWSRYADLLRADYPPPAVSGQVRFNAGAHTGYKFTASGAITASKTINLARVSNAPADLRQRIAGRGIMLHMARGTFAGYWVPENYPRSRIMGTRLQLAYPYERTVVIPAGSWSAYKYDVAGATIAQKNFTPARSSSTRFTSSATINGRWHVLVLAGTLSGYWLPAQGMTLL